MVTSVSAFTLFHGLINQLIPILLAGQAPTIPRAGEAPTVPRALQPPEKTFDRLEPEVMPKLSPYQAPHVRDWLKHGCVSPWHPLPPTEEEMEDLWIHYPNMSAPIPDYVAIRYTFLPRVHSGHEEVINGVTHSCVNLSILPDWILNDDTALEVLQLK